MKRSESILNKKFSVAAVICALVLSGCSSDDDLYAPREKNELLEPKGAEETMTVPDATTTTNIDSLLMQSDTEISETSTEYLTEPIVTDPVTSDGYWRDQLSPDERQVYDEIYDSLSVCKNTVHIDKALDSDELSNILNFLKEDHTEIFWIGRKYNFTTGADYTDITFELSKLVKSENYTIYNQKLEAEIEKIISRIPENANEYDKVLLAHDMLVNNTDYALDYTSKTYEESEMYYNVYGCLVDHYSVCDGYSKAFKLLMDRLGVRCGLVSGKSVRNNESHSWNYVIIDGDYYWIDVTWDDPVNIDSNEVMRELEHTYFCITDEQLLRDHTIGDDSLYVPSCTAVAGNYMRKNGMFMDEYSFDSFNRLFKGDSDRISVQFGNADAYYSALDDLISNNNIYNTTFMKEKRKNSYSYSVNDVQYILTINIK